ncbi:hypothetical protein HGM15179_015619 [Zosterops borbonicus]|uniref:Uncharacterized protein n=1 Tax=Zosterops borbonicus TaxID=364589 RepID=A0A8K1G4D3_9PASS|nr:hypothetical protein HGM15179_015619 [Zosterops borbonicus]
MLLLLSKHGSPIPKRDLKSLLRWVSRIFPDTTPSSIFTFCYWDKVGVKLYDLATLPGHEPELRLLPAWRAVMDAIKKEGGGEHKYPRRIRRSLHIFDEYCDDELSVWSVTQMNWTSLLLPGLAAKKALSQLNKAACWLAKQMNATSSALSNLLTDVDSGQAELSVLPPAESPEVSPLLQRLRAASTDHLTDFALIPPVLLLRTAPLQGCEDLTKPCTDTSSHGITKSGYPHHHRVERAHLSLCSCLKFQLEEQPFPTWEVHEADSVSDVTPGIHHTPHEHLQATRRVQEDVEDAFKQPHPSKWDLSAWSPQREATAGTTFIGQLLKVTRVKVPVYSGGEQLRTEDGGNLAGE